MLLQMVPDNNASGAIYVFDRQRDDCAGLLDRKRRDTQPAGSLCRSDSEDHRRVCLPGMQAYAHRRGAWFEYRLTYYAQEFLIGHNLLKISYLHSVLWPVHTIKWEWDAITLLKSTSSVTVGRIE